MTTEPPTSGFGKMEPTSREQRLAAAFVQLADTLVDEFDALELLSTLTEQCVDLLDASAAGIMLADQRGGLRMAAASSEAVRLIELFELQVDEGPCRDCYASGVPAVSRDLVAEEARWPRFAPRARSSGFASVSALPLRLRDEVIGALNIFHSDPGAMPPSGQRIGQALADVATIGILQERAIHRGEILTEQLQTALNSRISIEQAKGILAASSAEQLSMDVAYAALRGFARSHNRKLSAVAAAVVQGEVDVAAILEEDRRRRRA